MRLEVRGQLLARVLVVLRVPAEPARRRELHELEQLLLAERVVADDVDRPDLRHLALVDGEVHRDAVAVERRDRRRDRDAVAPGGEVLALDLLLGLVDQRLVVGATFGDPVVAQRLAHLVGGEFLHPDEVDLRDRRPLRDHHHQDVAFDLHADVGEEPGGEQRADRLRRAFFGHGLADLDREVAEDGSGLDALDAFDADVADDEGLERERESSEAEPEQCHAPTLASSNEASAREQAIYVVIESERHQKE